MDEKWIGGAQRARTHTWTEDDRTQDTTRQDKRRQDTTRQDRTEQGKCAGRPKHFDPRTRCGVRVFVFVFVSGDVMVGCGGVVVR